MPTFNKYVLNPTGLNVYRKFAQQENFDSNGVVHQKGSLISINILTLRVKELINFYK